MRGLGASVLALLCAAGMAAAQGTDARGGDNAAPPAVTGHGALPEATAPDVANGENAGDGVGRPAVPQVQGMVVQSPETAERQLIMTIDLEDLFLNSEWGQRVQNDLEARGQALADENERLATELSNEERDLTELRKTLPADEFRARAEDFDKRVVEVRRERDTKARELQHSADTERNAFFQATQPLLARLMQERGAVAVLDQRMVLVSVDAIDVTGDLIKLVDEVAGHGPDGAEAPAAPAAGEAASPAPQQ